MCKKATSNIYFHKIAICFVILSYKLCLVLSIKHNF